jgi:hypothetical protein
MPLHPQLGGMVERYIKTIEKHLRKVVASYQRDWEARLPIFLLDYRASTHDSTGLTPARLVFGRELRRTCDLLFGASPNKKRPTIDHAEDLWTIYTSSIVMSASCAGYHEGDKV